MTKEEFLDLMEFPKEWHSRAMYPDELFELQLSEYKPGHERSPEHYRCGAFHWWLRRNPGRDELLLLAMLATLDPDEHMAMDVASYIGHAPNADRSVREALKKVAALDH